MGSIRTGINHKIDDLPIQSDTLKKLKIVLDRFGVRKYYEKSFPYFNQEITWQAGFYSLCATSTLKYRDRDHLLQIQGKDQFNFSRDSFTRSQEIKALCEHSLEELKLMYPEVKYEDIEMLYFKTQDFIRLLDFMNDEYDIYTCDFQSAILETIIQHLYDLTEYRLIIPTRISTLASAIQLPTEFPQSWKLPIAGLIIDFYFSLHDLRGTRFCIMDTETTGLENPRPIQIAYLLLDTHLNYIHSDNIYIRQERIESTAVQVHGITKNILYNVLPSVEPEEAYEQIKSILDDERVVFIAHNASYDMNVLRNLRKQVDQESNQDFEYICTKFDYKLFSSIEVPNNKLGTILKFNHIEDCDIQEVVKEFYQIPTASPHDARYDIIALYLFLRNSKFFEQE